MKKDCSKTFNQNGSAIITFILIIGLIAGAATLIFLSNAAIPGDALYPIDLKIEEISQNITQTAEKKAELIAGNAKERLNEASVATQKNRNNHSNEAIKMYFEQKDLVYSLVGDNSPLIAELEQLETELFNSLDTYTGKYKITIESDDREIEYDLEITPGDFNNDSEDENINEQETGNEVDANANDEINKEDANDSINKNDEMSDSEEDTTDETNSDDSEIDEGN